MICKRDGDSATRSRQVKAVHVARDCVVYFLWSSGNYGLTFWLPKILTAHRSL